VRVVHGDVDQLALEWADQLVRERVALVVGVGLERELVLRSMFAQVFASSAAQAWSARSARRS